MAQTFEISWVPVLKVFADFSSADSQRCWLVCHGTNIFNATECIFLSFFPNMIFYFILGFDYVLVESLHCYLLKKKTKKPSLIR